MKNILFIVVLWLGLTMAGAGCGEQVGPRSQAPALEDLLHHNYVLISVDGQAYANKQRLPSIAFNEGFRVSGAVCNRFMGQGELTDGVLYVKNVASTKMICMADGDGGLDQLEYLVHDMLQKGAALALEGRRLTLSQGGHTLVYVLSDPVD